MKRKKSPKKSSKKRGKDKETKPSAGAEKLRELAKHTCKMLYSVLTLLYRGNEKSELAMAPYLETMIKHVELEVGSAECIYTLVEHNHTILARWSRGALQYRERTDRQAQTALRRCLLRCAVHARNDT